MRSASNFGRTCKRSSSRASRLDNLQRALGSLPSRSFDYPHLHPDRQRVNFKNQEHNQQLKRDFTGHAEFNIGRSRQHFCWKQPARCSQHASTSPIFPSSHLSRPEIPGIGSVGSIAHSFSCRSSIFSGQQHLQLHSQAAVVLPFSRYRLSTTVLRGGRDSSYARVPLWCLWGQVSCTSCLISSVSSSLTD